MILAKAPLRVSFIGGGSDIPEHYLEWGGDVISTAIDKFVYVAVNKTPHNHIKISYSEQELVTDVEQIKNDIVRNALIYFDIRSGIDISTFADIPTIGTGLAGSSAFTCALVSALYKFKGYEVNEYRIAELACHIEINMCGWKIGKQDQYASAFGGMNHLRFHTELNERPGRVSVNRIDPNNIDRHMVLIPTNIQRHASEILGNIDFDRKAAVIREMAHMASLHSAYLPSLDTYGEILNQGWKLKKEMSDGITNPEIDAIYDRCMKAGAVGCKLLGAGGGGYMLALACYTSKIHKEFDDRVCLDVKIAKEGAKVVYSD